MSRAHGEGEMDGYHDRLRRVPPAVLYAFSHPFSGPSQQYSKKQSDGDCALAEDWVQGFRGFADTEDMWRVAGRTCSQKSSHKRFSWVEKVVAK